MVNIIGATAEALIGQMVSKNGKLTKEEREELEALRDICTNMLDLDKAVHIFDEWIASVSDEET